jgi:hypothetical protein
MVQSGQHFLQDRGFFRLEGEQRFAACRVDAGDQGKFGSVVVEYDRRTLPPVALLHGFADIAEIDRPIDVDQLTVLAQHIQKLAKVLIRHLTGHP